MTTMVLGGLWHGAAWNFLFWGFFQGMMLVFERLAKILGLDVILKVFGRFKKYVALIIVQYFVFLGWLIFRVSNTQHLFYSMKKYITFDFGGGLSSFLEIVQLYEVPLLFLLLFVAIHTYVFFNRSFVEDIAKKETFYWALFLLIACLALYFLSPANTIAFIYFRF